VTSVFRIRYGNLPLCNLKQALSVDAMVHCPKVT
jgi:hypothetical protein